MLSVSRLGELLMTFDHLNNEARTLVQSDLQRFRDDYEFPAIYVRSPTQWDWDQTDHPFDLGSPEGITGYEFEKHIRQLLTSEDSDKQYIGIISVVYWGYANTGYRASRVERLWDARGRRKEVGERLTKASEHASEERFGMALACMEGVPELGRTPFASKVIAFLNPNMAGVYDNKINDYLGAPQRGPDHLRDWLSPHASSFHHRIRGVGSPTSQGCYQAWCSFLQETAVELNLGGLKWAGTENWRAIDVERALFAAANAY